MRLTVGEVSKLFDISVRTLHYYDEIGLLKPGQVSQSGYRYYDNEQIELLQEIIFFKELMIPLNEIKTILNRTRNEKAVILNKHKSLLMLKRERIDCLIEMIESIVKGEIIDMEKIKVNTQSFEMQKDKYKDEVIQRWGDSDAYKISAERTKSYNKKDWEHINLSQQRIFSMFYENKNEDINSLKVRNIVKLWQDFITKNFYPCSDDILSGLADMYLNDERFKRNIDKAGNGTAQFMHDAIKAYVKF